MNTKTLFLMVLAAAVAAGVTWTVVRSGAHDHAAANAAAKTGGRKVSFYQSPMHPWIKSDKPGKCTICGMDLAAVYEGDKGYAAPEGITLLGSNIVQVIDVQTLEVKRQPLKRSLKVAGMIDDDDTRHRVLSAYIDGRIEKLFVNFNGAEVTAGQPLATFYSPNLLATEREYVALIKHAPTNTVLQAEHRRMVDAAADRLRRMGLSGAQIAALPEKSATDTATQIIAPLTGTVVSRAVYEGQYVKEGEKLFEIADFSTMWFIFDAYERDLPWLKVGQEVEVSTPSRPGQVFKAPIRFINPNLNDMTRSAKVRVELKNPTGEKGLHLQHELLHKLYADGVVRVETPEVITVPRTAVLSPDGRALVYVEQGSGSYEQRAVKLGRSGDDLWEVTDGLKEGEKVVVNGNLLIDAQAQLNQAGRGSIPTTKPATTAAALTAEQRKEIGGFVQLVNDLGSALSGDDVKKFNDAVPRLHTVLPAFQKALAGSGLQATADKINGVGHLAPAKDLTGARKSFQPLSELAAGLMLELKADPEWTSTKVYQCPMTAKSFPGAPKTARWIQLQAPIRNPYFGAEMIDCGAEVKP